MILGFIAAPPTFADAGVPIGNGPACWADLDHDGWTDLVTAGTIWWNMRGKTFEKGEGMGAVVAADFDLDGRIDLFSYSDLKLFRNLGDRKFALAALPMLPTTVCLGACWGDFNRDRYPDLFIGGFEDWDRGITYPSLLLLSQKGKAFTFARSEANYRTRGVTACDFDRDGDLDVYVSNYRLQPNELLLNNGKGSLTDQSSALGTIATSTGFPGGHSIGACWGDFDGDGEFDLFAGNFAHQDSRGDQPKSRFLVNRGKRNGYHFSDLGTCGIYYQESYATPAAADYDNDGDLDLVFTTVYFPASFNRDNYPVLFRNDGKFSFADGTAGAGLAKLPPTYQAAWADYDRDGRVDLVLGGKLWHNVGPVKHFLEVDLGPCAIGTQVRVRFGSKTASRQVEAGTGQGNQNDAVLHFGLGDFSGSCRVEITPLGGKLRVIEGVKPDQCLHLEPSRMGNLRG